MPTEGGIGLNYMTIWQTSKIFLLLTAGLILKLVRRNILYVTLYQIHLSHVRACK